MTDRPSILAAECDRIDASAAKLLYIGLQLAEGGRRGIDASLLEQILGIPDATRLHSDWNTIDLAVIGHGLQRRRHLLLDGVTDLISEVHGLSGVNHVLGLGSTKGHVHIRAGGGILHSGGQLAFEILVLDGLDLDLDTGLLLERFGHILPILLAVTSCCVMPERNGLIVFGTSAGAAGTHAQHGRHRKSGSCNGFELHCLLLIDQIIIDKMMATTGISLEWVESGSMTATNAAAAPLADRESAFDSLRKFPFRFRCTYRLPKQITQSQVFCKIRKLIIFR